MSCTIRCFSNDLTRNHREIIHKISRSQGEEAFFVCERKTISHLHKFQPACPRSLAKSKSYGNRNQISRALEGIPSRLGKCPSAMSCCHTFRNFYSAWLCVFFFSWALRFVSATVWKAQIAVDSWPKCPTHSAPRHAPKKTSCHERRRKRKARQAHTQTPKVWGKVRESEGKRSGKDKF